MQALFNQGQSEADFDKKMRLFGLVVQDFSRSDLISHNNTQFISFKKQILAALQTANDNLPTGSTWDEQITQLNSVIMANSSSLISSISPEEVQSQLKNIDNIVGSSGDLLSQMPVGARDQS